MDNTLEIFIALSVVFGVAFGVALLRINSNINRLRAAYESTVDDARRRKEMASKPDKGLIRIWHRRLREQRVGSTDYEIYKKLLEDCGEKCGD